MFEEKKGVVEFWVEVFFCWLWFDVWFFNLVFERVGGRGIEEWLRFVFIVLGWRLYGVKIVVLGDNFVVFVNIFVVNCLFFIKVGVFEFFDDWLEVKFLFKGLLVRLLCKWFFFELVWLEMILVLVVVFCVFKICISIVMVVKIMVEFIFNMIY